MADEERFTRLRRAMERERLDALVCRLPEHVLMLTGYWPVCAWVYAVFPRDGAGSCILPDTEEEEARATSQMDQSKLDAAAVVLEHLTDYPEEHGDGVLVESHEDRRRRSGIDRPGLFPPLELSVSLQKGMILPAGVA